MVSEKALEEEKNKLRAYKQHWRVLSADVIEPRDCSDFETKSPVKDNDRISLHTLKI